ncbi:hypothetical protein CCACVL1_24582 [Corchorus capsularis]|uniref:BURP domain-containing protein n=1 Tax=Corchorus capsularis TaxID=210143 RepID=A0A1R3GP87_COCAP|nr:hypothetical protein CCACVL1_24582 [Corchorus capsularis]
MMEDSGNDEDYGSGDPTMGFEPGNASPNNRTIYFFENDIHPGKKMKLDQLTKAINEARFLSRQVADSMPFSKDEFPAILEQFSLKPESAEAKAINRTITNCERRTIRGEDMYCAKSMESFVELGVSKLGNKNIKVLSSEVEIRDMGNSEFTIVDEGLEMVGEKEIVCHKEKYPYAVFLCHSLDKSAVYKVPLVGEDGSKIKALAVCHRDTSAWNPMHMAFYILKVKPGEVPICHFLMREDLVWIQN